VPRKRDRGGGGTLFFRNSETMETESEKSLGGFETAVVGGRGGRGLAEMLFIWGADQGKNTG